MNPPDIIGKIVMPANIPQDVPAFTAIIGAIIRTIIAVGVLLSFFFLLLGGISWIISGGDEKAIAKARGRITAALIGLILLLSSLSILIFISKFFGISLYVIEIPTP